jgi:hypothetical protein
MERLRELDLIGGAILPKPDDDALGSRRENPAIVELDARQERHDAVLRNELLAGAYIHGGAPSVRAVERMDEDFSAGRDCQGPAAAGGGGPSARP